MSNIDRAAEVISLALADDADVSIGGNYNDIMDVSATTLDGKYDLTAVARALADAGLLAGAAALTSLDRVRDALTEIDRLEDKSWAAWKHDGDMFEQGRSDAYFHAHTIITEALGDTP